MYHVSAQGVDERMINVHYYYTLCYTGVHNWSAGVLQGRVQSSSVRGASSVASRGWEESATSCHATASTTTSAATASPTADSTTTATSDDVSINRYCYL